jgi:N-acetylgalactosamine kinase
VDLAKTVSGVKGAQLSGAGLGGCAMVLAEESALEELTKVLSEKYYHIRNLESAIAVCTPVAGSGVIEF